MHSAKLIINEVVIDIQSKGSVAELTISHKDVSITKDDFIFTKTDQFIPTLAIPKKKDDIRSAWFMDPYDLFYHDDLEKYFLDQAIDK